MKKTITQKITHRIYDVIAIWAGLTIATKSLEQHALLQYPKLDIPSAIKVIEEEKQKLGITNRVDLYTFQEFNLERKHAYGFSYVTGEGYLIAANKEMLNRHLIRHELYHIYKEDFNGVKLAASSKEVMSAIVKNYKQEENPNKNNQINGRSLKEILRYWFIEEQRASIYAMSGIKL